MDFERCIRTSHCLLQVTSWINYYFTPKYSKNKPIGCFHSPSARHLHQNILRPLRSLKPHIGGKGETAELETLTPQKKTPPKTNGWFTWKWKVSKKESPLMTIGQTGGDGNSLGYMFCFEIILKRCQMIWRLDSRVSQWHYLPSFKISSSSCKSNNFIIQKKCFLLILHATGYIHFYHVETMLKRTNSSTKNNLQALHPSFVVTFPCLVTFSIWEKLRGSHEKQWQAYKVGPYQL